MPKFKKKMNASYVSLYTSSPETVKKYDIAQMRVEFLVDDLMQPVSLQIRVSDFLKRIHI